MTDLSKAFGRIDEHHLAFLGTAPAVFHCHHFNLFLDQTVDDALGAELGTQVRTEAAAASAYALLFELCRRLELTTPAERMHLAQVVFSAMGHGRLELDAPAAQGAAGGTHLHYGWSWHEKYGKDIRRNHPADGFAAGFAAAAAEIAYELEPNSVTASEQACVVLREPSCRFTVTRRAPAPPVRMPDLPSTRALLPPGMTGRHEDRIEEIAGGLLEFLSSVHSDERGLIRAFGVYVTLHLAGYYNRITYESVALTRAKNPAVVDALEALLRESGQVCAFHTFGGILLSPEWEGLVGAPTGDLEEHVIACCAIARALGFGRWCIEELDPDRRFVLRAPLTYEAPYLAAQGGRPTEPTSYFLQGAAVAIMELGHRIPWAESPQLSDAFYRKLFLRGQTWKCEQTMDLARGDPFCEIVATPVSSA